MKSEKYGISFENPNIWKVEFDTWHSVLKEFGQYTGAVEVGAHLRTQYLAMVT